MNVTYPTTTVYIVRTHASGVISAHQFFTRDAALETASMMKLSGKFDRVTIVERVTHEMEYDV